MGKYMRKAKTTSDVAVMELSQSSFTVHTRAKTLALQKIQTSGQAPNPPDYSSISYLQLRNRKLEKPNLAGKQQKSAKESSRQNPEPNFCPINRNPRMRPVNPGCVGSGSIGYSKKEKGCFVESMLGASKEEEDFGVEGSSCENNLEFEGRLRSTRESTLCSLIRGSETIWTPPGSSMRPTGLTESNQQIWNSMRDMPTTHEMEEFFAFAEQEQQRLFTGKYNFDVVNDIPLPGRYEWVRVCTP